MKLIEFVKIAQVSGLFKANGELITPGEIIAKVRRCYHDTRIRKVFRVNKLPHIWCLAVVMV